MTWKQFAFGFRVDPAKAPPDSAVILLHDLGATSASLASVATVWGALMPRTAFIAVDGIEQLEPPSYGSTEPAVLDRTARRLDPVVERQLRTFRPAVGRVMIAGFGYGGTLALHMLLSHGWEGAGVLAVNARLTRPLVRTIKARSKVRLVECTNDCASEQSRVREFAASLAAAGVDVRQTCLADSALSDEAIRRAGAYLVELASEHSPVAHTGIAHVSQTLCVRT